MHHAAMANKKDMMFELARLGCDWRARADGIDGATAAFVLCGQHGKTTRQQVSSRPASVHRSAMGTEQQRVAGKSAIPELGAKTDLEGCLAGAEAGGGEAETGAAGGLGCALSGQQLASLADVTEVAEEEGDAGALADANMAALLEQVQLEDQG